MFLSGVPSSCKSKLSGSPSAWLTSFWIHQWEHGRNIIITDIMQLFTQHLWDYVHAANGYILSISISNWQTFDHTHKLYVSANRSHILVLIICNSFEWPLGLIRQCVLSRGECHLYFFIPCYHCCSGTGNHIHHINSHLCYSHVLLPGYQIARRRRPILFAQTDYNPLLIWMTTILTNTIIQCSRLLLLPFTDSVFLWGQMNDE